LHAVCGGVCLDFVAVEARAISAADAVFSIGSGRPQTLVNPRRQC
jgi:hypothetical protein